MIPLPPNMTCLDHQDGSGQLCHNAQGLQICLGTFVKFEYQKFKFKVECSFVLAIFCCMHLTQLWGRAIPDKVTSGQLNWAISASFGSSFYLTNLKFDIVWILWQIVGQGNERKIKIFLWFHLSRIFCVYSELNKPLNKEMSKLFFHFVGMNLSFLVSMALRYSFASCSGVSF